MWRVVCPFCTAVHAKAGAAGYRSTGDEKATEVLTPSISTSCSQFPMASGFLLLSYGPEETTERDIDHPTDYCRS